MRNGMRIRSATFELRIKRSLCKIAGGRKLRVKQGTADDTDGSSQQEETGNHDLCSALAWADHALGGDGGIEHRLIGESLSGGSHGLTPLLNDPDSGKPLGG